VHHPDVAFLADVDRAVETAQAFGFERRDQRAGEAAVRALQLAGEGNGELAARLSAHGRVRREAWVRLGGEAAEDVRVGAGLPDQCRHGRENHNAVLIEDRQRRDAGRRRSCGGEDLAPDLAGIAGRGGALMMQRELAQRYVDCIDGADEVIAENQGEVFGAPLPLVQRFLPVQQKRDGKRRCEKKIDREQQNSNGSAKPIRSGGRCEICALSRRHFCIGTGDACGASIWEADCYTGSGRCETGSLAASI
jgi:hypothetical protein